MIHIERLPEPDILRDEKANWLEKYQQKRLCKPGTRPDSKQYGHREVRDALSAMSFHKCFYCESGLGEGDGEIDHYQSVAAYPELAFEWNNLYLSCKDCNRRKLSEDSVSVTKCLDPCDKTEDPADHLTFDDESICAKLSSERGEQTIRKYLLNREALKYQRVKQLHQLERLIRFMKTLQLQDNQDGVQKVRERISRWKQRDHLFSLMFCVYLDDIEL